MIRPRDAAEVLRAVVAHRPDRGTIDDDLARMIDGAATAIIGGSMSGPPLGWHEQRLLREAHRCAARRAVYAADVQARRARGQWLEPVHDPLPLGEGGSLDLVALCLFTRRCVLVAKAFENHWESGPRYGCRRECEHYDGETCMECCYDAPSQRCRCHRFDPGAVVWPYEAAGLRRPVFQ